MARSDQTISFYNSSHTRIGLQAADARGLDRCWQQDRSVVPLAPISTAVCFLESRKITLDCFDRRPILNRPLVETKATRLSIARTRHAHVHDVSYYCCCAVGCTRSVVPSSCLVPVICGMRKISDTKQYPSGRYVVRKNIAYLDVHVRMGLCKYI